jgi:hypothetical protein
MTGLILDSLFPACPSGQEGLQRNAYWFQKKEHHFLGNGKG